MDRRTVLAILLMLNVAVLPSFFIDRDSATTQSPLTSETDTTGRPGAATESDSIVAPTPEPEVPVAALPQPDPVQEEREPGITQDVGDTVVVVSGLYRYAFSSRGARVVSAELTDYRQFAPHRTGVVNLIPRESDFMRYWLVVGRDTVELSDWRFAPSSEVLDVEEGESELRWTARRGQVGVELTYTFEPQQYRVYVSGRITGLGSEGMRLLIGLGPHVATAEKDTVGDQRSYGVVTRGRSVENLKFSSLDPGEREELSGPFDWIAVKSKYFLMSILTVNEAGTRLAGAEAVGGPRTGGTATNVEARTALPAPGGIFSFMAYIGPQEFRRLAEIGHDFEEVNPYGWFLRPVVSPFAKLIVRILVWMHENLNMAYGWVLVVFGIAVRVLLWPLNQKSMRSSLAMQAIQPEIKALQERYKSDPQRMQQEMMKLYKEHGVNPLGGCLPALLPMPILFALFFVFQNTIEFRGVPFLWLPDLSLPDPLFITPVVMAASMYLLFRIGQSGQASNPQAKMMMYVMPIMFLVFGIKFPAGLNVYYGVSNLVSLPQQWFIAKERKRRLRKKS